MSTPEPLPPVRATVTIDVPLARTFSFFTGQLSVWWPSGYSIGKQPFNEILIEPWVLGRWFERAADGAETPWGRVLTWEPPQRVTLAWQTNAQWQHEPELEKASEIEVRFTALGAEATYLELVHAKLERHGEGAQILHRAASSPDGWPGILNGFKDHLKASSG